MHEKSFEPATEWDLSEVSSLVHCGPQVDSVDGGMEISWVMDRWVDR